MDKLILEGKTNLPNTTNTLGFMQKACAMFEVLGYLGGDNYIVTGCKVTGTSVASGYVYLKGILMPFEGGTIPSHGYVQIFKDEKTILVGSGSRDEVSYSAVFGQSTNADENVAWTDITRIDNIISLMSQLTALNNRLTDAEDDILVNAQDIQVLDDRIKELELDEIGWTNITNVWGSLQGGTSVKACKIGKVVYVQGIVQVDYNPGENTVLFTLPAGFPDFTEVVRFSSGDGNDQEIGEMKTQVGSRNILAGPGMGADSDQFFSVAIPVI